MGSQWTSKYTILRDLSVAQGRKVPAAIVGSVVSGEKPPVFDVKEDTEEEFFQNCVGGGGDVNKPDLPLIKQMLNWVHESDPAKDEDETEKVVQISKLNPLSGAFVPKGTERVAENETTDIPANGQGDFRIDIACEASHVVTNPEAKPQKKRRERNAAIMSLLEKEAWTTGNDKIPSPKDQNSEEVPEVKLLKPIDFIRDPTITESVDKVNEWLQKPVRPRVKKTVSVSPINMFRKKAPALSIENKDMFKRKSDSSSIKSSDSDVQPKPCDNVFVPSSHANEYYNKFIERKRVKEVAQEDLWARAERLMKEIDAKRLNERRERIEVGIEVSISGFEGSTATVLNDPDVNISAIPPAILLPQHRHDLPEECQVCLALAKYKRLHELSLNK